MRLSLAFLSLFLMSVPAPQQVTVKDGSPAVRAPVPAPSRGRAVRPAPGPTSKVAAPHPRLSLMAAVARSEDGEASRPTTAAQSSIAPHWLRLADCESGEWDRHGQPIPGTATWDIVAPPHYGGLQFTLQSWEWVGGQGLPSDASPAEQVARAEELQRRQGWGAWPVCSVKVGLREGR